MFPTLLIGVLFCAYGLEATALAIADQAMATRSRFGCCDVGRQDFIVDVWCGVDRGIKIEDLKDLY